MSVLEWCPSYRVFVLRKFTVLNKQIIPDLWEFYKIVIGPSHKYSHRQVCVDMLLATKLSTLIIIKAILVGITLCSRKKKEKKEKKKKKVTGILEEVKK